MDIRQVILGAALGVAVSAAAYSADGRHDGNELKADMEGPEAGIGRAMAMGYVNGVADALYFKDVTCEPANVTQRQVVDIVLKFLRDHPERLHEQRFALVSDALMQAFPCKGN